MENKKYVFVPSYQSLLFAIERFAIKNLVIITESKSVIGFCEKINLQLFRLDSQGGTSIKDILKHKRYLIEMSSKLKQEDIFFCVFVSTHNGLFLIKKLKNNNNIYFYNRDLFVHKKLNLIQQLKRVKTLKWIIFNKILFLFIYKINFNIIDAHHCYYLGIDIKRFKKFTSNKYSEINHATYQNNIRIIQKSYKILSTYDVLYISSHCTEPNYSLKVAKILRLLKDSGLKVGVKPHPNFVPDEILNTFTYIEKTIPSEFLSDFGISKVFLGDTSTSLNYIANFKPTYSMINLSEDRRLVEVNENFFLNEKVKKNYNEINTTKEIIKIIKNNGEFK